MLWNTLISLFRKLDARNWLVAIIRWVDKTEDSECDRLLPPNLKNRYLPVHGVRWMSSICGYYAYVSNSRDMGIVYQANSSELSAYADASCHPDYDICTGVAGSDMLSGEPLLFGTKVLKFHKECSQGSGYSDTIHHYRPRRQQTSNMEF